MQNTRLNNLLETIFSSLSEWFLNPWPKARPDGRKNHPDQAKRARHRRSLRRRPHRQLIFPLAIRP